MGYLLFMPENQSDFFKLEGARERGVFPECNTKTETLAFYVWILKGKMVHLISCYAFFTLGLKGEE